MHNNLDLLHTGPYHPDGTAKDPHAHHRAEHLELLRAARRHVWRSRFARLRLLLIRRARAPSPRPAR